jgi:hypothetical protein
MCLKEIKIEEECKREKQREDAATAREWRLEI